MTTLTTLHKLLNGNHVLLENEYYVKEVVLVDESTIARRPSGWFCKNDKPHLSIDAERWGSIQVEFYGMNPDSSIMVIDDEGNNWNLQILVPVDPYVLKNMMEELAEDEE